VVCSGENFTFLLLLYFIQTRTILQHVLRYICINEHRMYQISFCIYSTSLIKAGATCRGAEILIKYRKCLYPNPNGVSITWVQKSILRLHLHFHGSFLCIVQFQNDKREERFSR
jgi:hypothetical protein